MKVTRLHTCTGHLAALYAIAPGATARHFLTAGGDGWVTEWQLDAPDTGRVIAQTPERVFSMWAAPGGNRLVLGNMNGGLHWLDRSAPQQGIHIQHHRKSVYALAVQGNTLLSGGGDGILTRWDMQHGRSLESIQLSHRALRSIHLSPDGRLAVGASDGNIYILKSDTFELLHTVQAAHTPSVFSAIWHPDGAYLLSGGRDAILKVWSATDYEQQQDIPAHWYTINHIAFDPSGAYFATASRDKTIKIWNAADRSLVKVLDTIRDGGHVNSVNRLLWMSDRLVSVSDDRTAIIWEIRI